MLSLLPRQFDSGYTGLVSSRKRVILQGSSFWKRLVVDKDFDSRSSVAEGQKQATSCTRSMAGTVSNNMSLSCISQYVLSFILYMQKNTLEGLIP